MIIQLFVELLRRKSGNFAIAAAIISPIIVVSIGCAIDIISAYTSREDMQTALDTGLLSSISRRGKTDDEDIAYAKKVVAASIQDKSLLANLSIDITKSGISVEGTARSSHKNMFMGLIGLPSTDIVVTSGAIGGDDSLEVALALDVTGSMRNDIGGLRSASRKLNEILFARARGEVRVAVVPFAASVNPGADYLKSSQLDWNGDSPQHGRNVEGHWAATGVITSEIVARQYPGCITTPDTAPNPGKSTNSDVGQLIEHWLFEAISPTNAYAATVTPSTSNPLSGTIGASGRLQPTGFGMIGNCRNPPTYYEHLTNPSKISHFDLYDRLKSVSWKGCVEARSEPYDVTDDAPNSRTAGTLFFPYFWFDDAFANDWVDDYENAPYGFGKTGMLTGSVGNTAIFKYNLASKLTIDEIPPITTGPNKGCPDQIMPLSDNEAVLDAKLNALIQWDSGGTVITEGVSWGWRVLSPGEPYVEAKPYDKKNRKVLVLMSDGVNEISSTGNTWASNYTAYGGLRYARLPTPWTFADATLYLNSRTLAACNNAKKAGISIYTVLFREASASAQDLMKACATSASQYFTASDSAALEQAFTQIAEEVSTVRLTK